MNKFTIGELLPDDMIQLLVANAKRKDFHTWCLNNVVYPNLEHIDQVTNQKNDPDYLAYLFEYITTLLSMGP